MRRKLASSDGISHCVGAMGVGGGTGDGAAADVAVD